MNRREKLRERKRTLQMKEQKGRRGGGGGRRKGGRGEERREGRGRGRREERGEGIYYNSFFY